MISPVTIRLPAELAIGEVAGVAGVTGVSAHTLRYYERIGLVQVGRDAGGRRVYDPEALALVVFVTVGQPRHRPAGELTVAGHQPVALRPHADTRAGDMTAKDGSAQRSSAAARSSSLIRPAATIAVRTRSIVSVRNSISGVPP